MASIRLGRDFLRPTFKVPHGTIAAGQPNPLWESLLEVVVDKVIRSLTDQDDGPVIVEDLNVEKWTVAQVVEMCGNGAGQYNQNIFDYPAFVRLPIANLVDNVPLYLTAPRFLNPDGTNGARKKWSEWQAVIPQTNTHALIELNGGGEVENGKIIARLVGDTFNVISARAARNQLAAYQATLNPNP